MELNPNTKDELSIKEIVLRGKGFLRYLSNRRKTIFIAIITGAVLGLVYSFVEKPVYTAALSFAMEDTSPGGIGDLNIGSFAIELGGGSGGAFSSSNLPELFKSRNMVERTLLTPVVFGAQKISLAEMYIQNEGWRKDWENKTSSKSIEFPPNTARLDFSRAQDSILGVIYEDLTESDLKVSQKDKKIAIVTINLKSSNELFAKQFTEALADQVSNFYIDYKSKKARDNLNILMKQTDSIRGQLNSAINGVAISIDNTFNLNPALNVLRTPASRIKVDVEANTAILKELVKQTELAKVALRKDTPLIQVIDSPILPLEKDKISKIAGPILGGVIGLILIVFFLVFKHIFKQIME
jgi:uncharacterized protein involved in exopolysaccharide biosynthesis